MKIRKAKEDEMGIVRTLFQAYAAELKIDLCFQNFDDELANLPGIYDEPLGCILVLEDDNAELKGVVALKQLSQDLCEMKRLYISSDLRKLGYGKKMSLRLMEEAKLKGYDEMNLDTLDSLKPAIALYESLGFEKTEAYNYNPNDSVLYFKKVL